jgi:hypothetical protein
MNIIALILLIVAAVVFLSAGIFRNSALSIRYLGTGLGLLTVGLIVQFAATSKGITF